MAIHSNVNLSEHYSNAQLTDVTDTSLNWCNDLTVNEVIDMLHNSEIDYDVNSKTLDIYLPVTIDGKTEYGTFMLNPADLEHLRQYGWDGTINGQTPDLSAMQPAHPSQHQFCPGMGMV